jgi:hypothetical protein
MSTLLKKAEKAVSKTAETAGKNPKKTLYVLGGALLLVGAYKAYQFVNKATSTPEIDDQVNGTGGSTNGATITDQQAINYAQQLLDAFNAKEPVWGTDEATVEAVFKLLKNGADFVKVYKAFGTKDYNGYNSPPTGFWSYLDSYEPRNLVYWLASEIDTDEPIYPMIKQRVESAGFVMAKQ